MWPTSGISLRWQLSLEVMTTDLLILHPNHLSAQYVSWSYTTLMSPRAVATIFVDHVSALSREAASLVHCVRSQALHHSYTKVWQERWMLWRSTVLTSHRAVTGRESLGRWRNISTQRMSQGRRGVALSWLSASTSVVIGFRKTCEETWNRKLSQATIWNDSWCGFSY